MSANNIVVIKKEDDGKFRGYHRDYDAYCEGQYDYEGPCQFCENGCEMCDGKGHYTPLESVPIFEADMIEEVVYAYHKWLVEMNDNDDGFPFYCEYGYRFEGLEPNAETIKAMEETDKGEGLHKFDSVEELIEELHRPTDTELLDFLQLITDNASYTGKVVCRKSTTDRGWRLHETSKVEGVSDVRQAITNYMKWVLKGEKQNENNHIC